MSVPLCTLANAPGTGKISDTRVLGSPAIYGAMDELLPRGDLVEGCGEPAPWCSLPTAHLTSKDAAPESGNNADTRVLGSPAIRGAMDELAPVEELSGGCGVPAPWCSLPTAHFTSNDAALGKNADTRVWGPSAIHGAMDELLPPEDLAEDCGLHAPWCSLPNVHWTSK